MSLNYDDLSARLTQVLGYLAGATSIDDLAGGLFDRTRSQTGRHAQ